MDGIGRSESSSQSRSELGSALYLRHDEESVDGNTSHLISLSGVKSQLTVDLRAVLEMDILTIDSLCLSLLSGIYEKRRGKKR